MAKNKWAEFKNPKKYTLVDLGRPASFLIPVRADKIYTPHGRPVMNDLRDFITDNFGGYTEATIPFFGIYRNKMRVFYDRCYCCKVSFAGKEKIPLLLEKLAEVARLLQEQCIYFEAGQYATLIFPASGE